ncbi:TFIIH basal transcription factor complex helicase XPB subunit, putative [Eimeria tenella]|uniref:DNA 3'-5' helicase n=1 Tax=Eimeria tenella TaxID=5802 RepID=U6KPH9_EIMTE|nr:TFIIH basal transcription factor complex helicase XPB subunit, putative [Eimeria tenella]CDJ37328.1 TFIIH basal transcription factor complex helicase XPB subunit, putative [Eimeria tenella]|eukprot:XP_013228166.1 TFIIH basal transcription factor complex helicase XPB subunit, putative [Eimeria tenella]
MFSNGRARSGIIVLPCGAGKTLTGITAVCTLQRSAVVLTTSAVAVEQWKRQFLENSSIKEKEIMLLTAESKQQLWGPAAAGVLLSTYTMLAFSGRRSAAAAAVLSQIQSREWGILIFDEVQFAPAPAFRKINALVRAHCRLGLTATLVREDDLIKDLQWIIGPKLYEANWIDLQNQGYLAKVSCQEVWCPMTAEFYREYLRAPYAKQRKLWVCNPSKLMVCEFLLKFHEAKGDKIIVFSDNVFALLHAARALNRPFIYGKVCPPERMAILTKMKAPSTPFFFRKSETMQLTFRAQTSSYKSPSTLLPGQQQQQQHSSSSSTSSTAAAAAPARVAAPAARAAVALEGVAAGLAPKNEQEHHHQQQQQQQQQQQRGVRQEAQRLGRILRAKPRGAEEDGGFNAYFYSLISKDTLEMVYADKRQQFIIDQGYSYKVLHCRDLPLQQQTLVYGDRDRQQALLRDILLSDDLDKSLDEDEDEGAYLPQQQEQQQQQQQQQHEQQPNVRVVQGGLAGISGKPSTHSFASP